jgi:hypothetical protein
MTDAQRRTLTHLNACHAQLDRIDAARDVLGEGWVEPAPRLVVRPLTAWRMWIWDALCNGTIALAFASGWVAGMLAVVAVLP